MNKSPERCIEPVMKCCQYCTYGHTVYDECGDIQDEFCIFGFEDDVPTQEEIDNFNKWYNEVNKSANSEKPTE